ncbi:MAG: hypothetical protein IT215_04215, partial [Chitinophagaceae bacterium]|nr:hypothetical protein [Chitinophagaceae bacterium]
MADKHNLIFPQIKGEIKINPSLIIRIEADGPYSIITSYYNSKKIVTSHLDALKKRLKYNRDFLKINRSNLINTAFLRCVWITADSILVM